ncbi:hypothetical protein C8J56DRAFT_1040561 [Mycena floridula]|nr:hypothetical protein C8J56DRAFT_1040561 [Mycena floridula]
MSEDCTANIQQYLRRSGEFIMHDALPIIAGTIFWTLYLVSVVLTVIVLRRKGFTRARISLLALIAMMFILATLVFVLSLYPFFHQTREIFLKGIFEGDELVRVQNPVATVDAMIEALNMLMLITGDCIVIWRAYAVWTRSKTIIFIPVVFLLGFIVNFPFFVACNIKHKQDLTHLRGPTACFATDASAWILSFCANISATLMIFYTAWPYFVSQRTLRASGVLPSQGSKVAQVLLLLVESGFAYFIVMIFSIIIYLWPIPTYRPGTVVVEVLGAITSHCIAMVPTLTILLVSLYGSFDEHSTIDISQPIHFATRPTELSYASAIRFPNSRNSRHEPTSFPVVDISALSLPEDKTPQDIV